MEIRRHNGQCGYGEWRELEILDLPPHIKEEIETAVLEGDVDPGDFENDAYTATNGCTYQVR